MSVWVCECVSVSECVCPRRHIHAYVSSKLNRKVSSKCAVLNHWNAHFREFAAAAVEAAEVAEAAEAAGMLLYHTQVSCAINKPIF